MLNRRRCGEMRKSLVAFRMRGEGLVHYIADNGVILGWALHHPPLEPGWDNDGEHVQVYVRAQCRRQGIGRKLLRAVERHRKPDNWLTVMPWEIKSTSFFRALLEEGTLRKELTQSDRGWSERDYSRPIR